MTNHQAKRAAVKQSLTAKLQRKTRNAIAKHGLVSNADIRRMQNADRKRRELYEESKALAKKLRK